MVRQYSTKTENGVTLVMDGIQQIGRVVPLASGFYHARHLCRHEGVLLKRESDAVEYVIGIELFIEAKFAGEVFEVAA